MLPKRSKRKRRTTHDADASDPPAENTTMKRTHENVPTTHDVELVTPQAVVSVAIPIASSAKPKRRKKKIRRTKKTTPTSKKTALSMLDMLRENRGHKLTKEARERLSKRRFRVPKNNDARNSSQDNAAVVVATAEPVDGDASSPTTTTTTIEPTPSATATDDGSGAMSTALTPTLRIVNGELVMDSNTVQVRTDAVQTTGDILMREGGDGEDLQGAAGIRVRVTSAAFKKRSKTSRWTVAQTRLFYEGLREFGTDFGAIARRFGARSRRQIKLKFKKEERTHPKLVNMAIRCHVTDTKKRRAAAAAEAAAAAAGGETKDD